MGECREGSIGGDVDVVFEVVGGWNVEWRDRAGEGVLMPKTKYQCALQAGFWPAILETEPIGLGIINLLFKLSVERWGRHRNFSWSD